jgi:hypothetical protein
MMIFAVAAASNVMLYAVFLVTLTAMSAVYAQNADYQKHYLVGLLNYPNSFIPDEFKDHTSGTYIETGTDMWVSSMDVPFHDIVRTSTYRIFVSLRVRVRVRAMLLL